MRDKANRSHRIPSALSTKGPNKGPVRHVPPAHRTGRTDFENELYAIKRRASASAERTLIAANEALKSGDGKTATNILRRGKRQLQALQRDIDDVRQRISRTPLTRQFTSYIVMVGRERALNEAQSAVADQRLSLRWLRSHGDSLMPGSSAAASPVEGQLGSCPRG
jgi:hypothetical protein